MSRTFKLVSGSDEINLIESIEPGTPGIMASRGGLNDNSTRPNNTFSSSSLVDGARLRLKKTLPVVARYRLNMVGTSHDNVASQIQAFQRILRKGDLNALTQWQQEPLYIQSQTTNESGVRYSKVLAWNGDELSDFFTHPYEVDTELDDFEILLVREPYWRNHPPGFVPHKQAMQSGYPILLNVDDGLQFDSMTPAWDKNAQFDGSTTASDYFDAVSDAGSKLTVIEGAKHDGLQGMNIANANTTTAYGRLDIAGSPIKNFSCFWIDPNSIGIGANEIRIYQLTGANGAAIDNLYIELIDSVNPYQMQVNYADDDTADVALGNVEVPDEFIFITAYWESASAPAADDGIIRVNFYKSDGTLLGSVTKTDVDSDAVTLDDCRYGTVESAAGTPTGNFYIDTIYQDVDGAPFPLSFAGRGGNYGLAIPINNVIDREGTISGPSDDTEMTFDFWLDLNTLTMASNDQFMLAKATGSGATGVAWQVEIIKTASAYTVRCSYVDDDSAVTPLTDITLTDQYNHIVVEWQASSGLDDGKITFTAGRGQEAVTGIDNDGHDIDAFEIGVDDLDAGTIGLLYIDQILWGDEFSLSKYHQQLDFELNTGFVANFRQTTGVLSHIFMEDTGTGFSANFAFTTSFPYWEVSGSTPAVNDNVYFGSDEPFYQVIYNLTVGGSVTGLTIQPEYWNGAWTSFESVGDSSFSSGFTGHEAISWEGAADWTTVAVNGETKYWIRLRITAITAWTTSPEQGDHIVFSVNHPYVEINTSQIVGDVPALAMIRLINYEAPIQLTWAALGIKSRGLDNFVSRLNAGGANPTTWTEAYTNDTSKVADETAPGGNVAQCTFATNQDLVQRVDIDVLSPTIEPDFEGTYRIYLRAKQTSGDAGDVSIQLQLKHSITTIGKTIKTLQTDGGIEVFDMGVFSIKNFGELGDEANTQVGLSFRIWASSANGTTPNIDFHDLVLIPIDEYSVNTNWNALSGQGITSNSRLQIDNGLLREAATQMLGSAAATRKDISTVYQALSTYQVQGALPLLEPRKRMRIYFLLADDSDNDNILESGQGQGIGVEIHTHNQWIHLRGAD